MQLRTEFDPRIFACGLLEFGAHCLVDLVHRGVYAAVDVADVLTDMTDILNRATEPAQRVQ
jgi:hypothetical protein